MLPVMRSREAGASLSGKLPTSSKTGGQSILIDDSPVFVTNRAMTLMVNQARFLVQGGFATVQYLDPINTSRNSDYKSAHA